MTISCFYPQLGVGIANDGGGGGCGGSWAHRHQRDRMGGDGMGWDGPAEPMAMLPQREVPRRLQPVGPLRSSAACVSAVYKL